MRQNTSTTPSTETKPQVVIVAAGTGGHVFPGLAVAAALRTRGIGVAWVGTPTGPEGAWVKAAKVPFFQVKVSSLRGKNRLVQLLAPFKLTWALFESLKCVFNLKPKLVLSMGGYVSGPVGLAARLLGCDLFIHEQNAVAGLTNKLLAPISQAIFSGFENDLNRYEYFRCIGNPLRAPLIKLAEERKTSTLESMTVNESQPLRLLVLGGSLGARTLNQWVPKALAVVDENIRPKVLHQSGKQHVAAAEAAYREAGVRAEVVAFIDNMDQAYAIADLVICRAGALTVSEVAAMGLPAIFLPYPYAVDNHQAYNAQEAVTLGAAVRIIEAEASHETLQQVLQKLIQSPQELIKMRQAAWANRNLTAAEVLADAIQARLNER